jgi:hypothetical protein
MIPVFGVPARPFKKTVTVPRVPFVDTEKAQWFHVPFVIVPGADADGPPLKVAPSILVKNRKVKS